MLYKRLLFVLAVAALIVTACGASGSAPEEPAPTSKPIDTFTVPSYATNKSVMDMIENSIDGYQSYAIDPDDGIVKDGFMGVLVDSGPLEYIFRGYFLIENYGQQCVFDDEQDRVDFERATKTVTVHVRATILDQDFLKWCQSNTWDTIGVYEVTATADKEGYLVRYMREEWTVKPIFRLDADQ